jgi:hypothetical protein
MMSTYLRYQFTEFDNSERTSEIHDVNCPAAARRKGTNCQQWKGLSAGIIDSHLKRQIALARQICSKHNTNLVAVAELGNYK